MSGRTVYSVSFFPEDYRSVLSQIHRLSSQNFLTNYALTEMSPDQVRGVGRRLVRNLGRRASQ